MIIEQTLIDRDRIANSCICCDGKELFTSPAILMPFVAHRAFNWKPVRIDETWGLNTIISGNAYSICNTLECVHCGCLFLDIRFSEKELDNLYRNYRDAEYVELRNHYEPGYHERNEIILKGVTYINEIENFVLPYLKNKKSLLDWGGDTGKNTPFRSFAIRHIYDINPREVVDGIEFINKSDLKSQTYDLIVCNNVLEHTPFPLDVIMEMKGMINRDGIIYIEVPKEKIFETYSGNLHEFKRHWHEHVNFFTNKSLEELCARAGLLVLQTRELEIYQSSSSHKSLQLVCSAT